MGYGAWETSSPAKEKPMQVPTAPTNVNLMITSDTKLTVSFEEPITVGGDDISYYLITWDRSASFNSLYELPHRGYAEVPASVHRSYTINDLTPNAAYYVKVSARNSVGYGPSQNASPAKRSPTAQIPGKPSSIVVTPGSGQMVISWQAPRVPDHGTKCNGDGPNATNNDELCKPGMGRDHGTVFSEADGGSAIITYRVEYDTQSDFLSNNNAPHKSQIDISADDTDSFTTTITGLTPGRRYYVRIAANNAQGLGQFCNEGGVYCDEGVLKEYILV